MKIVFYILLGITILMGWCILSDIHSILDAKKEDIKATTKEKKIAIKEIIKDNNIRRIERTVRENIVNSSLGYDAFTKNLVSTINEIYINVDRCIDNDVREWLKTAIKDPELYIKIIIERELKDYCTQVIAKINSKQTLSSMYGEMRADDE